MHCASGGRETRLADPRPAVQGGRRGTRPGIAIEAGLAVQGLHTAAVDGRCGTAMTASMAGF